MIFYLVLSFSAFFLSLLGTRVAILAARKRAGGTEPLANPRKSIPNGGGIALVMTLIICLLIADIHYGIVLSLFLLAAISLLGDIIEIPVLVRIMVQILAVLIAVSFLPLPLFGDTFPLWADKIVTVALWVWFINIFNLMDGIDGITAMEVICIATGFSLIIALNGIFPDPLSVYSLILMSAGCGFFWWNWYPAKILLGEVGSAPIGFLVGYMLFIAIASGYAYPALILPAYYLSDATATFIRRSFHGKIDWESHHEHYYQMAVRAGRRHDTVVRYIFGLNFLLILLATFSVLNREFAPIYLATSYMATFMVLGFFAYTPHNPRHASF